MSNDGEKGENSMKNKIKKCFNAFLKLILNGYTILIFVAMLALFAINIITSAVIAFLVLIYFGTMFFLLKIAECKKTYFISFLISFVVLVLFTGSVIHKIPALSYNFGTPKHVASANDINYCLNNGIKVVSFVPENVKKTQYVQKEDISLTGRRQMGPNDGHIKFHYSIVELDDVNILLKHTTNSIPHNKGITGYLTKLDSLDEQVYENCVQDKLFGAIIEIDSETLDSNILSWKIWTIFQFVISLMSLVLCICIASKYYRNRALLKENIVFQDIHESKNERKQEKTCKKLKKLLNKKSENLYKLISRNNEVVSVILKQKNTNFANEDFKILQKNIMNIENNSYMEKYTNIQKEIDKNNLMSKEKYTRLKKEIYDFSAEIALMTSTLRKYI